MAASNSEKLRFIRKNCTNPECEQQNPQPADQFYPDRRVKSGLSSRCKSCKADAQKRSRAANPEKSRAAMRRWREKNPNAKREWRAANKDKVMEQHWRNNLGIKDLTYERFLDEVEAQEGRCAICNDPMDKPNADHDHDTGRFRGLLCGACNTGLGQFKDDPERLRKGIEYLMSHQLDEVANG